MNYKDINNKENFKKFKSQVVKDFETFIDEETENNYKKSVNLTYWLNAYRKYLKQEKTYNPNYSPVFEKGTLIQIDLGFNVGNELGGVHYGIVLNSNDDKNNPNLTIIPLSSMKENKRLRKYEVNLQDSVYKSMELKVNNLLYMYISEDNKIENKNKEYLEKIKVLKISLNNLEKEYSDLETNSQKNICELTKLGNSIKEILSELEILNKDVNINSKRIEELTKKKEHLKLCLKKFSSMKKGSFAIINQITTISKIRIKDPVNPDSPLFDIKISNEHLSKIESNIKKYLDIQ